MNSGIRTVVSSRALRIAAVIAGAVSMVACSADTLPGSRIAKTRVLGARVVVNGDEGRAWPRSGEAARLTWLVVAAGPARPVAWSFFAVTCRDTETATACLADRSAAATVALATPAGMGEGGAAPTLDLIVPAPDDARVDRVIVGGVICAGGGVVDPRGPVWARCAPGATDGGGAVDETDVLVTVPLQLGAAGNAPPTLGGDAFTWNGRADATTGVITGGAPWNAGATTTTATAADLPCTSDPDAIGAPVANLDGSAIPIVIASDAGDRETIPAEGAGVATRESLQLSAFTTRGQFDTQFAGVLGSDTRATTPMTFEYTPPAKGDVDYPTDLPPEGRTVRFFFVLRDLRGGIDWQARTVCLQPPAPHS